MCKCNCKDGCWNPKTCPCYRFNQKLRTPLYSLEQRIQQVDLESVEFVEGHFDSNSQYFEPYYKVGNEIQIDEARNVFI